MHLLCFKILKISKYSIYQCRPTELAISFSIKRRSQFVDPRYRLYSSRSNPITHTIAYKTIDKQSISNSKLKYAVYRPRLLIFQTKVGRPICLNL